MASHQRSGRSVAALSAMTALNLGCWTSCHDERTAVLAGPTRADLPALVAGLAAVLLQFALVWLLLLTVLVALEPHAERDLASYAGCPAVLRRLLMGCCGAAAAGVLAVPAYADQAPLDQPLSTVLEGLPLPERTLGARVTPHGQSVLVRRGDTLWAIAASRLPTGRTPGDVDRAWRALYAGNRSRIGSDPDLITPGMRLRFPPTRHQEDDR